MLKLGTQVHAAHPDWMGELYDVEVTAEQLGFFKPEVGFWTSSLDERGRSEWLSFSEAAFGEADIALHYFEVQGDPRILILRGDADIEELMLQLGLKLFNLDIAIRRSIQGEDVPLNLAAEINQSWLDNAKAWEWISRNYDAVHVPADFSRRSALRPWDVESTVWFRPGAFLLPVPKQRSSFSVNP